MRRQGCRNDAMRSGDRSSGTRALTWGFGALLDATAQATTGEILLPAFVGWSPSQGFGILDPVAERGLPHSFYRMDPGFELILSHLEELPEAEPCVLS